MLASAETPLFAAEEAKKALIGLARDLRGLAFAFNTKTSYMMLFDWMYPFKQFLGNLFLMGFV
jgi:exportin-7